MNTKSKSSETPVTISGFIIGRFDTFMTTPLTRLDRLCIPIAAAVPSIVAATEESTAIKSVLRSASISISSLNNASYHRKENPEKIVFDFVELNEKKIITRIGA
ncbi:hypothetical protein SDC9_190335 [bioreactor metagenome]|uniref:Uncharacterized protein n=1 Tax=bioreactor metagenome TaxID=1076179 RepID=A0A645HUX7_9ZZZZ